MSDEPGFRRETHSTVECYCAETSTRNCPVHGQGDPTIPACTCGGDCHSLALKLADAVEALEEIAGLAGATYYDDPVAGFEALAVNALARIQGGRR